MLAHNRPWCHSERQIGTTGTTHEREANMNRYRISTAGGAGAAQVFRSDGWLIANLYGVHEAEAERLKRWIEAAPDSDGVMDGIIKRANEPLYQSSAVRKEE